MSKQNNQQAIEKLIKQGLTHQEALIKLGLKQKNKGPKQK